MLKDKIVYFLQEYNKVRIHDVKYNRRMIVSSENITIERYASGEWIYNLHIKNSDFHSLIRLKKVNRKSGLLILEDDWKRKVTMKGISKKTLNKLPPLLKV